MRNEITMNAGNLKVMNNYICWNSVLAGTLVAITVGSLLNLLGIGIGLIAFNPGEPQSFSGGTIAWLVISTILYSIMGGWIAGFYAHSQLALHPQLVRKKSAGMLNGFLAWSLASLFTLFVMTTTAGFIMNAGMQSFSSGFHTIQIQADQKTKNISADKKAIDQTQLPPTGMSTVTDDANGRTMHTASSPKLVSEQMSNVLGHMALIVLFISLIGVLAALIGGFWGALSSEIRAEIL